MVEAADTKKFSRARFDELLTEMAVNPDKINPVTFADFLDELVKLLALFGAAMAIAFSGKQ